MAENNAKQEKILFEAIRLGDLEAFERFMCDHEMRLFHVILGFVHQRQEAEDLTQEAFMKFYKIHTQIDTEMNPGALLYQIGKNCARDWLRKKNNTSCVAVDFKKDCGKYDLLLKEKYSFAQLMHSKIDLEYALKKIKPLYAKVVTLFYIEGYSYEDIADVTDIPLNTVKTYLHRARKALKSELHYEST